jgi:hypothetical protein
VAISLEKTRLLRFARNDTFLSRIRALLSCLLASAFGTLALQRFRILTYLEIHARETQEQIDS